MQVHSFAALIFTLVALLHLIRIIAGWELILGGWIVPVWLSIVVIIITGYLAFKLWHK